MQEIVQEIGAYAGLAAVLGLAVLSALYFSQARDVKRLREWAGRAPERSEPGVAAPAVPARVVAQPQPRPAPAQAASAGARPAASTPAAQQVAGAVVASTAQPAAVAPSAQGAPAAGAAERDAEGGDAPAGTDEAVAAPKDPAVVAAGGVGGQEQVGEAIAARRAPPGPPAQAAAVKVGAGPAGPEAAEADKDPAVASQPLPAAAAVSAARQAAAAPPAAPRPAQPAGPGGAPATSAGARAASRPAPPLPRAGQALTGGAGRPPRLPSRPMPGQGVPGRAALQQTQIISPAAAREPWHRRLLSGPLRIALAIAGALVLLGAAAFAATQLGGEDSASPPADRAGETGDAGSGGGDAKPQKGRIVPSKVTVAVLNGTTIPGLAAQVGDKVGASGFDVGTVANASAQQRAESVVLFSPGHEREAAAVGRKLRINQRESIDPDSQSVAGDATVVVIAGQDQTR